MDRIRQKDDEGVAAGIHPQRCAGESGVAEAADGKDLTARPGEGGVDVPAEAAGSDARCGLAVRREDGRPANGGGGLLRLRHQLQRGLLAGEKRWAVPASLSSRACANKATSPAVEKTPACPATPPMRRVVGSWTVPRRRWS